MKLKTYKCIGFLIAAFLISSLQAQKFDKKFSETFKVNKDVILAINASNADINVTTWNRNEVSVKATITVDGLSKKEAQKFLKNWEFEALGNKSKVQINANANRFLDFGGNNFKFDFDFEDIVIPEIDFENLVIDIPEFDMPDINIPDIKLDFDEIWSEIDEYDFDNDADDNTKTFSYKSNGKKKTVVIKSKKEWEKFKRSGEFDKMKKDLKQTLKKAQDQIKNIDMKMIHDQIKKAKIQIQSIDKEKIQAQIRKAKIQYDKIDKVKIRKSLAAAKESIEKMKRKMDKSYRNGDNVIIIEDGNSKKKVKITRKITIKVPKNAKFDLNTRHSKVKLPKGKTSGKVSYGTFKADEINGGDLNIFYAPVHVKVLKGSTLTLNNITDATIASVMNTKLTSNSSGLKIDTVFDNVNLSSKYGELVINEVVSNLKGFILDLRFSDATIDLKNVKEKLNFKQGYKVENVRSKNIVLNGNFTVSNDQVNIKGKQSELKVENE
jgi:hypothetical protein